MKIISLQKGQSAVEFAVVLPVFILTCLGLVQLGLIFMNSMMLKYTAFMTARVAAVYCDEETRNSKAKSAVLILKSMQSSAAGYNQNVFSNAIDGVVSTLKESAASVISGESLTIKKIKLDGSKADYINVTVTYCMPLTVPIVNKIFGLIQNKNKFDIFNGRSITAYAGFPFYVLKAQSIMRVE